VAATLSILLLLAVAVAQLGLAVATEAGVLVVCYLAQQH
jgi:hypothetical protein